MRTRLGGAVAGAASPPVVWRAVFWAILLLVERNCWTAGWKGLLVVLVVEVVGRVAAKEVVLVVKALAPAGELVNTTRKQTSRVTREVQVFWRCMSKLKSRGEKRSDVTQEEACCWEVSAILCCCVCWCFCWLVGSTCSKGGIGFEKDLRRPTIGSCDTNSEHCHLQNQKTIVTIVVGGKPRGRMRADNTPPRLQPFSFLGFIFLFPSFICSSMQKVKLHYKSYYETLGLHP